MATFINLKGNFSPYPTTKIPVKEVKTITAKIILLKKVSFNLNPTIFIIENEDRKGPWETFAVDRFRFTRRIEEINDKIGWCFNPSHRQKILNTF